MRKTKQVNIRLTDEEIKIIELICEKYHYKSISDYVRHAALHYNNYAEYVPDIEEK